jgi:signal transduction histidine kinase
MTQLPRRRPSTVRRPVRRDVVVAGVVTVVEALSPRTGGPTDDPSALVGTVGLLLAVAQGVPLAWRRFAPEAVLGVVTVAFLGQALLVDPVPPIGAWVALASLSVRRDARVTAAATAGVVVAVVAGYLGGLGASDEWALPAMLTVAVAVAAQLVRERRARLAAVADAAAAEERLRIARDLHDVLGHSLSGIAVQSSTGRLALEADRPEVARAALERIEEASRSSMAEVRSVLGALRDAAAPRLESVDDLVEEARVDGSVVSLHRDGDLRRVPAAVGQVAYRVVQEALTNARRHGGPGPVTVDVSVVLDDDRLLVDVRNDGPGRGPGDLLAADPGHGITGMRERVESIGGTLEAGPPDAPGPSEAAGWRVHAVLPLSTRRQDDGSRP